MTQVRVAVADTSTIPVTITVGDSGERHEVGVIVPTFDGPTPKQALADLLRAVATELESTTYPHYP